MVMCANRFSTRLRASEQLPFEASVKAAKAVQTLISRNGSFPLEVALDLIARFSPPAGIVLDPFCGKGTTLLAARLLRRTALGVDIAPEAAVCSAAKLVPVSKSAVRSFIADLVIPDVASDVSGEVRSYFHPRTLQQILGLRNALARSMTTSDRNERNCALFAVALSLGILHGHASYSLSISSSHVFAMAPAYVARFATSNGLTAPVRDVRQCLLAKLDKVLIEPALPMIRSSVRMADAFTIASLVPSRLRYVDLILTSPPYLNSMTYAKDNWLRQWFLGYDYRTLQPTYFQTGSISKYCQELGRLLNSCGKLLQPGGHLLLIVGRASTSRNGQSIDIASALGEHHNSGTLGSRALDLVRIEKQEVISPKRYNHALNKTNGHDSTPRLESVMIFRKI